MAIVINISKYPRKIFFSKDCWGHGTQRLESKKRERYVQTSLRNRWRKLNPKPALAVWAGQLKKITVDLRFIVQIDQVEHWWQRWDRKTITEMRLFRGSHDKVEESGAEISVVEALTLSYSRSRVCFSVWRRERERERERERWVI